MNVHKSTRPASYIRSTGGADLVLTTQMCVSKRKGHGFFFLLQVGGMCEMISLKMCVKFATSLIDMGEQLSQGPSRIDC